MLYLWVYLLLTSFFSFDFVSAYRDGKYSDLRLNHIQIKGSRNSYHLRPNASVPHWDFHHESIDKQLDQGIYALEYDFYYQNGSFVTAQHYIYDDATTCKTLYDCLVDVKNWLDSTTVRPILWIALGNKEEWTEDQWTEHDNVVRRVFSEEELLTPDDLRGDFPTLREAIMTNGWPAIKDVVGKVIIILDQYETHQYYENKYTYLEGRVAFPYMHWDNHTHPNAAILKLNNPYLSVVTEAVKMGYIVRTRSDQYLPKYPVYNQTQIDYEYFAVIDRDRNNYLDENEIVQWLVYGATNDVQDANTAAYNGKMFFKKCAQNGKYIYIGDTFYCLRSQLGSGIFVYANYSTMEQSLARTQMAIQSGAHHISSDFPTAGSATSEGYYLRFNDMSYPVLCNPVTTNSWNTSGNFHIYCDSETLNNSYLIKTSKWNKFLFFIIIGSGMLAFLAFMYYQNQKTKKIHKQQVVSQPEIGKDEEEEEKIVNLSTASSLEELRLITVRKLNCYFCACWCHRTNSKMLAYNKMNYNSTTNEVNSSNEGGSTPVSVNNV